ncbi:nucleotidyltransferase family protein [Pseudoflavonifractor phocaeensis]|uniref:nucleotidyltransferase domain-containing protein n=1 Tax=Pseudoflavonifractor phocaeensis TaxID=1870988 RepID=UPI00195809B5|nr:nucleotidyltransferase family protein [Pseudoflavonifractor phocaeensis]MBM6870268.1 nucleotidyltransferase family protein [Pseudoflavonifractor phocaeensis]
MEAYQLQLLEGIKGALTGQPCPVTLERPEDWQALWRLAGEQKVIPLAMDALAPALRQRDPEMLSRLRGVVFQTVSAQVRKTKAFQTVYRRLEEANVHPLVVKGLICRALYPKPDLRVSADEDLLLPPEEMPRALQVLEQCGLTTGKADEEQVVSCFSRETGLYLELHRTLFSAASAAYGGWNRYFDASAQRAVKVTAEGMEYRTLCHQDHLLYLILHSLKHFLHSGFGVRQVCDICLFTMVHGEALCWPELIAALEETRADLFTANLLEIGRNYLGLGTYPQAAADWMAGFDSLLDCQPLLEDLLAGGIYGGSTDQRKHSSLITLHAVEEGEGSHRSSRLLHTVFPSARELQGAYPYLRENPWLLPAAWVQRIARYTAENRGQPGASQESVEIGERRVELLKKYRVIG